MNGLDLFSGIGGIALALRPWVTPVAYCEIDPYAQGVLLSRMADRALPIAPIWPDVRTLTAAAIPSEIDIITGGFPCQDLSVAGNGAGLAGERSGLVFELLRLVGECRPQFVFLENVPALAVRGLDRLLLEFHALGYDARWTIVSAAEMGAPHLRERIWILAHSRGKRVRDESDRQPKRSHAPIAQHDGEKEPVADSDSDSEGLEVREQREAREFKTAFGGSWWATEPDMGRVAHGIPMRVDRLKCLGNGVVPQAAQEAFKRLAGIGG